MKNVDAHTLAEFAAPILAGLGYELVDLEWKPEAGAWVLRVYIDFGEPRPARSEDGAEAHISHEDCTRASRALGAELDVADLIPTAFNLEVSSPGLNRPLKRESDFRRYAGQKAKIKTKGPVAGTITEKSPAGRRNFAGRIVQAQSGVVRVDVDGQLFDIPVAEVEKANLVYEF